MENIWFVPDWAVPSVAVFAEAGLSAATFLSMATGEAFAAWTRMPPHDGLKWPIVRAGERRWTLAEAAGLCAEEATAVLPDAAWWPLGRWLAERAAQAAGDANAARAEADA